VLLEKDPSQRFQNPPELLLFIRRSLQRARLTIERAKRKGVSQWVSQQILTRLQILPVYFQFWNLFP
jgi:hypothetical protein